VLLASVDDGERVDAGCESGGLIGGTCPGATADGRCRDQPWLGAVSCGEVLTASDEDALEAALAEAEAGDCIDLAEGRYGDHSLPSGVSLLGRGWDCVALGELSVDAGVVRGVTAKGVVALAGDVTLEELRLADAEDGVSLEPGASASLTHVSILDASRYGLAAFDGGDVSLDAVFIRGSEGPGLWAQCGEAAGDCPPVATRLTMRRSRVEAARVVGLSLVNVDAALEDVRVTDTTVGPNFEAGGNVSVVSSSVEARGLSLTDAADFGLLVQDSTLVLGASQASEVVVERNLRGVWIQGQASDVVIADASLTGNLGVGVGVDRGASLRLSDSSIADTASINLPVLVNGVSAASVEVGDGVYWGGGATAQLSHLTVASSDRVPILIDGSVGEGSALDHVTLTGGDEAIGIIHQNLYSGANLPALGPEVPEPTNTSEELYPVPGL